MTTMNGAGPIGLAPTVLLHLGVVAAELLTALRQLAESRAAILVALLLELEDVLDPQSSVLSGLAEGNSLLLEQPHEVLTRHVEQVSSLLCRHLATNGNHGDRIAAGHDF